MEQKRVPGKKPSPRRLRDGWCRRLHRRRGEWGRVAILRVGFAVALLRDIEIEAGNVNIAAWTNGLEIILGPGLVGQEVGLKLPDRVAFSGPLSQGGRAHRLCAQTSMGRAKVATGWRKCRHKQRNTRLAGHSGS